MGLAGPVLGLAGLHLLVLGLRPVAGHGSGCSRAGGGVVGSVVGWECLACLPLFYPIGARLAFC